MCCHEDYYEMPHPWFPEKAKKKRDLGQKKVIHRGDQMPTKCLLLHSFEECDLASVSCVAAGCMSPGPSGQLQNVLSFCGSNEGEIKPCHVWNGRSIETAGLQSMSSITALFLVPEQFLLWCGDDKGAVVAFKLSKGDETSSDNESFLQEGTLCGMKHDAAVTCFAADSKSNVYSGAADGTLFSWSIEYPFEYNGKVGQHSGKVTQITVGREDYLISVGSQSTMVHVWPVGENSFKQEPSGLRGHTGGGVLSCLYVYNVSHAKNGLLWTGGDDGFIHVWRLNDPIHVGSHINFLGMDKVRMRTVGMNDYSSLNMKRIEMDESAESGESVGRGDNSSIQVDSIRMLFGHKEAVISICENSGIVFSCDTSGLVLSWNAERYWLLHAFTVSPGENILRPPSSTILAEKNISAVGEEVRVARCIGFIEGFLWLIDTTSSGSHCFYMPNHTRLKKTFHNETRNVSDPIGELLRWWAARMNIIGAFVSDAAELFLEYVEFHNEMFLHAIESTLCQNVYPEYHKETSSSSSEGSHREGKNTEFTYIRQEVCEELAEKQEALEQERALFAIWRQKEEEYCRQERQRLKEEAICLSERAEALDCIQASLLKSKSEQDDLIREHEEVIRALQKRNQEKERELVRVSAELSFLRLKYGDWGGVNEDDM